MPRTEQNHVIHLESTADSPDPELVIEVVGGPHPYLWVGSGHCYGTVDINKQVERALRESVQSREK